MRPTCGLHRFGRPALSKNSGDPADEIKHFQACSYHLSDAEAVPEVVEGDAVVVAVDLKQEVLQDVQLDVKRRQEVQVGEHHLQKHQHLRLLPLPVNSTTISLDCFNSFHLKILR